MALNFMQTVKDQNVSKGSTLQLLYIKHMPLLELRTMNISLELFNQGHGSVLQYSPV